MQIRDGFHGTPNVAIDAAKQIIRFATKKPGNSTSTLSGTKAIHLSPYSETAITIPVPFPFLQGLIESGPDLFEKVVVMDGRTSSPSITQLQMNIPAMYCRQISTTCQSGLL